MVIDDKYQCQYCGQMKEKGGIHKCKNDDVIAKLDERWSVKPKQSGVGNMKTINIKGKEYVEVAERIKCFNREYPNGKIQTIMMSNNNGAVIIQATVTPDVAKPERFFTGYAHEKEDSSFINKTSYIENCETSAVGRALGMMGIGLIDSVASANEVMNAMENQEKKPPKPDKDSAYRTMLQRFIKAKEALGDEDYYEILGSNGYEHSNQITSVDMGEKILSEMRRIAKSKKQEG